VRLTTYTDYSLRVLIRLAKMPHEINVGEVVLRMEPDLGLVACLRESGVCTIESACVLAGALKQALAAFMQVLDSYSLADLIKKRSQLWVLLKIKPPRISHSA
jgi:Rrf2 family transcriptional regulator, nitric oxide-sensitive transcriptional repressor